MQTWESLPYYPFPLTPQPSPDRTRALTNERLQTLARGSVPDAAVK